MKINSEDQYYELQKDFLNMGLFNHPNIINSIGSIDFKNDGQVLYSNNKSLPNKELLKYKRLQQDIFKHDTFITLTPLYDGTVNSLPKETWLNPIELIKFIMSILDGLKITQNHIPHKDIKPTNIAYLFTENGDILYKIID